MEDKITEVDEMAKGLCDILYDIGDDKLAIATFATMIHYLFGDNRREAVADIEDIIDITVERENNGI